MRASLVRRRLLPFALLVALALGTVACGPEGSRTRGQGEGADVGNRGEDVQMHGDQAGEDRIYYDTPVHRPPVEAS